MLKTDSAHVLIFLIIILLCFPTYRAITRWLLDRLLSWWEFCLLQTMTALTIIFLLHKGWSKSTIIVLIIYNLFWLFEPLLRNISRRQKIRSQEAIAIGKYEHLLKEHPDNPVYHTALGDLYLAHRRYDEAITAYRRAVSLMPEKYRKTEQRKLEEAMLARNAARDSAWR
ncbi:MAG: tetratricopeptide repeat protein [Armatimonadota bacterium]